MRFARLGHLGETGEMGAGFWWVELSEREQLEDLGVDGRIILKRIFEKRDGEALSQFIWCRIGTRGELL